MAREPHRSSEILDAVALVVVDMQDAFLNVMPDREAVLRRTAFAIEAARAFGIKVIFTEQVPSKLGPTHPDLLALAPEARVFAKNEFSALLAEGLHEYLRRINAYHLLLAGIETPICIYQTALHAQDNDLDVTLLSDCTTGRRPEDCVIVLEALSRAECHVLPAETVFYSMLGSSLNPRFAHFTRIVKRYAGEGPIGGGPTPAPETEARPEREEAREGSRRGDERRRGNERGRGGDRHRHPGRPDAGETAAEAGADDASTEELRAEDGISETEADQPSYEEATAEHSGVEEDVGSPEPAARPKRTREVAASDEETTPEAPDAGTAGDEPESDDDDGDERAPGDEQPGEDAPKKRRGRRRRGGARRRRARERAAAANGGETEGGAGAGQGDAAPSEGSVADAPVEPESREGGAPAPSPDGPPLP